MDLYDHATAIEELERERSIERIRSKASNSKVTHCVFCNDSIKEGKFCSIECRDDYELEAKLSHICGRG